MVSDWSTTFSLFASLVLDSVFWRTRSSTVFSQSISWRPFLAVAVVIADLFVTKQMSISGRTVSMTLSKVILLLLFY